MDVIEAIKTKLDIREYDDKPVDYSIKLAILDAGRLASSGLNSQHWRFILVDSKEKIRKLAEISTSGKWVSSANFAIIVLTDPKYPYHALDAGRAITYMQLAAWSYGIAYGIYTGYNDRKMREEFNIPDNMHITAVVSFGYPKRKIIGKKTRLPLSRIAYHERYDNPIRDMITHK